MKLKAFLLLLFLIVLFLIINKNAVLDAVRIDEPRAQMEFDEEKWKAKKGWGYAYRNEMLDDLMNDPEIRALKKDQLLMLLGEPSRINGDYLYYLVDQKRAIIMPLHTKTLVINFSQDSTINWMKIHE